jgi:hypothetical protein
MSKHMTIKSISDEFQGMPVVRVKDLKDQIGKPGPHPFLKCLCCGAEYSSNKGDYFMSSPEHVFECCDEPMTLCIKRVEYIEVNADGDPIQSPQSLEGDEVLFIGVC